MAITPNTGMTDVTDTSNPLYTNDSTTQPNTTQPGSPAQATGTSVDASTVQGILAVTAKVAGPNKLVATDSTGKLPLSIIPPSSGGVVIAATGAYSTLKASPLSGQYFAFATDVGQGALVFNSNISGVGDSGWLVISGG